MCGILLMIASGFCVTIDMVTSRNLALWKLIFGDVF
jgi:hypothetical protein